MVGPWSTRSPLAHEVPDISGLDVSSSQASCSVITANRSMTEHVLAGLQQERGKFVGPRPQVFMKCLSVSGPPKCRLEDSHGSEIVVAHHPRP